MFLVSLMLAFSSLLPFSLVLVSFFPFCSHSDIPNCSPKRQILRCQLILAFLQEWKERGSGNHFQSYCHWQHNGIKLLYVGSTCIHFTKNTCTNSASLDPSSLLLAFLTQNKMHSPSLLYNVWKPP